MTVHRKVDGQGVRNLLLRRKRTNRVAWGLVVVLAARVLVGTGLLVVRVPPYWVAKYRGRGANLRGAALPFAPLREAFLDTANLEGADLGERT
jgi:hypothetical protein